MKLIRFILKQIIKLKTIKIALLFYLTLFLSTNIFTFQESLIKPLNNPIKVESINGAKIAYSQAYQYYINNDYKNALLKFNQFIDNYENDPLSLNSYYYIATIYHEIKKYDLAIEAISSILLKYERSSPLVQQTIGSSIYLLATIYEDQQLIKKSRYYLQELIKLYPDNVNADDARVKLGIKLTN